MATVAEIAHAVRADALPLLGPSKVLDSVRQNLPDRARCRENSEKLDGYWKPLLMSCRRQRWTALIQRTPSKCPQEKPKYL